MSHNVNIRLRLLIILSVTGFGAVWLALRGPVHVVRGTTPLPDIAPFWYMLSAFPVLGMLIADFAALFLAYGFRLKTIELGLQILTLILVSNIRLVFRIAISGHSLLFAYFILRKSVIKIPVNRWARVEWFLVLCLYTLTAYVKVAWWNDPMTVISGTLLAIGLAGISHYALKIDGQFM